MRSADGDSFGAASASTSSSSLTSRRRLRPPGSARPDFASRTTMPELRRVAELLQVHEGLHDSFLSDFSRILEVAEIVEGGSIDSLLVASDQRDEGLGATRPRGRDKSTVSGRPGIACISTRIGFRVSETAEERDLRGGSCEGALRLR